MNRDQWLRITKIVSYSAIAVIAMAWATDLRNAILVSMCWLAGFLNEFYVLRLILKLVKRQAIPRGYFIAGFLAVGLNIFVIVSGYGLILAAAFASFILIDFLILRFR